MPAMTGMDAIARQRVKTSATVSHGQAIAAGTPRIPARLRQQHDARRTSGMRKASGALAKGSLLYQVLGWVPMLAYVAASLRAALR